jgi:signal transduction histidine kinase
VDIGCEEVERLERLVSGLRRVATHKLERRTVSLRELVARAEVLLRDQLGTRLLQAAFVEPAMVRCDPDQALQMLVNLLSNGVDAAGPEGAVGVSWTPGAGDGGTLTVWDSGDGLPDDPSRVFAVWYTTKAHGTGLGLAITHRLVRAHGWSIDAERAEGTTRFVITIPARDVVVPRDGFDHRDDMEVA